MPGAFLDVLDVIESLGCDHGEGQWPQSAATGARRKKATDGVRGSKNKCDSGATGVSGEGPGKPLLVVGAENGNGFLLTIDRGEDAENPKNKKSDEK